MRLISFLGLGEAERSADGNPTGGYFYHNTTYRFNQDSATDIRDCCYVARAITQRYIVEEAVRGQEPVIHPITEVFLLATEQAENAHLEKILGDFEVHNLPTPNFIRVPHGANAAQQWEQFNAILETIPSDADAKVVFDITHGFRSQPFFAAAVINYVRATRKPENVPEMRVLYGEYNKEKKISDVWDMTTFITLLDWSNALQGFMKTGHGAALAQLATNEDKQIRRVQTKSRPQTLNALARSLKAFSENIATVRVPEIITGKGAGSAKKVLENIDASEEEVRQFFKPLYPLLEELKDKLQDIPSDSLFTTKGHAAILALTKLYVDYERYPEAAIVLREGWVSLYAVKDPSANLLGKNEREKAESAWYNAEGHTSKEGYADLLSSIRNDIQHGGFRTDPCPADKLMKNLNKVIERFSGKLEVEKESG